MESFRRLLGALGCIATISAHGAAGGEAAAPVRYEAAFFARFAPRTALDMVEHVPSFALRKIDEERRGFSAAAGNVLIDGKPPSAKSQSLADVLQRIPAAQVLRIEVLRGSETTSSASADAVIVNVVRLPTAGAGVWSAGFEYAQQHEPAPNGYFSWAGRVADLEYALGAQTYALKRELPATRRLTSAAGDLLETRTETSPREFTEYAIDGELARDLLGGRFRATGQVYRSDYAQENTLVRRANDGTVLGDELAPYAEDKRTYEIGAHFESGIDPWQWTLATLFTRSRFDSDSQVVERDALGSTQFEFRQIEIRETGESILRSTAERRLDPAHRIQVGLEGALNTLDANLELNLPLAIPNAEMHVEESRGEAFLLHTWRRSSWSTETRLAAEYSRLDFTGDVRQSVDLSYLKPSLQITRSMGQRHQVRARLAREIEQLDFADFASAAALSDDRIEGGNPNLKPQTAWRFELGADLRLGARSALGLRAYHDWLDDVADLVPLVDSGAPITAPGNIGSGELYGLQVTFDAPLAPVIVGGTFKADITLQDPSVKDPLTGRERTISRFPRNTINTEFRQDLQEHGLAWGVKYAYQSSQTEYRVDETDRERPSPSLDVFVERKLFAGMKVAVTLVSAQGSPELRRRAFYDQDRTGALQRVEDTRSRPGRWLLITLSGTL